MEKLANKLLQRCVEDQKENRYDESLANHYIVETWEQVQTFPIRYDGSTAVFAKDLTDWCNITYNLPYPIYQDERFDICDVTAILSFNTIGNDIHPPVHYDVDGGDYMYVAVISPEIILMRIKDCMESASYHRIKI